MFTLTRLRRGRRRPSPSIAIDVNMDPQLSRSSELLPDVPKMHT